MMKVLVDMYGYVVVSMALMMIMVYGAAILRAIIELREFTCTHLIQYIVLTIINICAHVTNARVYVTVAIRAHASIHISAHEYVCTYRTQLL